MWKDYYMKSGRHISVVIGRFQPLHLGHCYLINKAAQVCDKLIIILGSSDKKDAHNPWSVEERKNMIGRDGIVFEPVTDHPDDDVWLKNVEAAVNKHTRDDDNIILYGHKKPDGYDYEKWFKWTFREVDNYRNVNASDIRKMLIENKDASDYVPENVWDIIKSKTEILSKGKHLTLNKKIYKNQDGHDVQWEYAERANGVQVAAIIGVTADDDVILVRQFRAPVGRKVFELPAGITDVPGETLKETIAREFKEETGYSIKNIKPLFQTYSSPGLTSETVHIFRGDVGEKGEQLDKDIEVYLIPRESVPMFLTDQDSPIDCKILAAVSEWQRLN